jgi:hypothetical protein
MTTFNDSSRSVTTAFNLIAVTTSSIPCLRDATRTRLGRHVGARAKGEVRCARAHTTRAHTTWMSLLCIAPRVSLFVLKGSDRPARPPAPTRRPAARRKKSARRSVRISGPRPGRSDPAALGPARPAAPFAPPAGAQMRLATSSPIWRQPTESVSNI